MTTSAASAGTPRPALFAQHDSLIARITGVLLSPRATLAAVAQSPRAVDVLVFSLVVTFVSTAVLYSTEVGQFALLDQWERTAIAFGQPITDAEYATMQAATRNGVAYAALTALASVPLLAAGLAALLAGVFRLTGAKASYNQVLAVTAHASIVLALRQLIASPISYARETLASPTTLTMFFTGLDEASPLARFFGAVDVFVLWWLAVLAIGIAAVYGRRARSLAIWFAGTYIVLALLLTGVMALLGGTR